MSFIILAPPNIWSCASLRIGIGVSLKPLEILEIPGEFFNLFSQLCLSICYSAIFIKTNRISRIFNQGVKSIQRPLYTSPISQVAISSGEFQVETVIICEPRVEIDLFETFKLSTLINFNR